ncbi:LuxR C-terminal-related transcriptional regulator [Paenibacillus hodogayensis]|uniref:LuxR C-terminal-related transcriptional regulator n=1 Tax=Paenibacillus hodogayensis TaxID=279208 RepID=A0ABV5VYC9_9BACL
MLVLDDYHLITNADVHDSVAFFIDHMPARFRLFMISRSVPPLPLPRLRASKQIKHMGVEELRFTQIEINELRILAQEQPLSSSDLTLLEQKTEGWAAGLILALLSIEGRSDVSDFIESFSGNHRYVTDYLLDEVLLCQSEELQAFLLQTSILNRITSSLAEAVTGRSDSSHVLAFLERSRLFFVPLDDTRSWFRFHHLFGEMLRKRLDHSMSSKEIAELHHRAYHWFNEQGLLMEAISHALTAHRYDEAATAMDSHLSDLIKNGEEATLLRWLQVLPLRSVVRRPDLFYYQAGIWAASGRSEEARELLDRAIHLITTEKEWFPVDVRKEIEMRIEIYRATIAYYQGDIDAFIERFDENRESIVNFGTIARVVNLGEALLYRGPIGFGGRLQKMAYLSAKASESPVRKQALHQTLQGHGYVLLADLYYEWDQLDQAQNVVEQALADQNATLHLGVTTPGIILLSKIYEARGEPAYAEWLLQKAISDVQALPSPHWQLLLEARLVRIQLSQGRSDAGERWIAERHIRAEKTSIDREYVNVTLARFLIHQGHTEQAVWLLRQLVQDAKRVGRLGSQIEALLLLALAYDTQGKRVSAAVSLEEACKLAEPERYVRIFLDEGKPLADLISRSLRESRSQRSTAMTYIKQLLPLFHHIDAGSVQTDMVEETNETHIILTKREREILQHIADGESIEEIARSLHISHGTVKRYTHNLYQKLQVKNRVQAVTKAKELRLW